MSDSVRNTSASDEAVGRVISRLRTRVALLSELDAVTRRRTAAIADERLDAIARLGEARQGIVERLLATSIDLEAAAREAAGSASGLETRDHWSCRRSPSSEFHVDFQRSTVE